MSEWCASRQAPAGMYCVLEPGHEGDHENYEGYTWGTPDFPAPVFVDWHARAEEAEAAIQRVRMIPQKAVRAGSVGDTEAAWLKGWNAAISAVTDALDGDGDK